MLSSGSSTVRGARKRSQTAAPSGEASGSWNDVLALLLILASVVHLLALVTYTPNDLPSWISFASRDTPNDPTNNVIGPVGAMLAGYSYFVFGAAAYLIPAGLLWFGVTKLLVRHAVPPREMIGFAAFVVSGACLAHFQTMFLQDWPQEYNILSPGGCVGYALGGQALVSVIGLGGAILVVAFVYVCSVVLLTGFHPLALLYGLKAAGQDFRARREERRLARATEAEKEKAAAKRAEKERRQREKEARRADRAGKDADAEADASYSDELPLEVETQAAPEPKIIDASVRRASRSGDGKKPSLAELRRANREKREKDRGASASSSSLSPLTEAFANYELPDLDLLDFADSDGRKPADRSTLIETQNTIIRTLATFGITVTPGDITRGPTITRYEIYPSEGLRVSRIANLEADIARATKAERINIIAPIPGKDTVGIEIANSDKILVPLRELLEDEAFSSVKCKIPLALGKDVYGNTLIADLAQMPHLLVAGATGSGKSVCINSIIASLLFQFSPDQLRFIMIDPKVVEMQNYNSLPHLAIPVVTDPKKVLLALRWVVNEMERRYQVFAKVGVRNFDAFNKRQREEAAPRGRAGESEDLAPADSPDPRRAAEELKTCAVKIDAGDELDEAADSSRARRDDDDGIDIPDSYPYIVVIIDELADLMQTAPADVEMAIARITQMARAAGIHLIVATQTPRADVITGVIKANIPSRIAFQVASALDSRVILDSKGAEKLVGKGDMLYLPPGTSQMVRAQGAMVSDEEIFGVVQYCAKQAEPVFESDAQQALEDAPPESDEEVSEEDEEILEKCLDVIAQEKKASTSLLQRRLRLGYTRAARMIDILEARGIIGPGDGAKPREILVDLSDSLD